MLWNGDELFIYDHELSLAVSLPQIAWQPPWTSKGLEFLSDHVFYDDLKGNAVNLDRFTGAFEAITASRLDEYVAAVPEDWKAMGYAAVQIAAYLNEARENLDGIISAVRRLLR